MLWRGIQRGPIARGSTLPKLGNATKLSSRGQPGPAALTRLSRPAPAPCSSLLVVHDSDDNTPVPPRQPCEYDCNATIQAAQRRCTNPTRCTVALVEIHAAYIRRCLAAAHRPRRRRGQRTRRRETSAGAARHSEDRQHASKACPAPCAICARTRPSGSGPTRPRFVRPAGLTNRHRRTQLCTRRTVRRRCQTRGGPAFYANLDRGDLEQREDGNRGRSRIHNHNRNCRRPRSRCSRREPDWRESGHTRAETTDSPGTTVQRHCYPSSR